MKTETIEEFLARGGSVKKVIPPKLELDTPKGKEENRAAMKGKFAWNKIDQKNRKILSQK